MRSPTLDLGQLLRLRRGVARFGGMDLTNWSNIEGHLGRLGADALRRGCSRRVSALPPTPSTTADQFSEVRRGRRSPQGKAAPRRGTLHRLAQDAKLPTFNVGKSWRSRREELASWIPEQPCGTDTSREDD